MAARTLVPKVKALEAIRARKGLSLSELAEAAGLSSRTIDNVMAGKPVLFGTIQLMATKLGVEPSEISEMADTTEEADTYGIRIKLNIPHKDFNQDRLQTFADLLARLAGGTVLEAGFTEGSTIVTVQLTQQQISNLLDLLPDFRAKARAVLNQTAGLRTLPEQLELQGIEYPLVDAVIDVTFPAELQAIPEEVRGQTVAVSG
jgi:transcriptional regulator with XRE-family HTH domain